MDEKNLGPQAERRVWAAVDWSKAAHQVAAADDGQRVLDQFRTGASLEDLRGLAARLRSLGPVAGIAVEATPNPVVPFLVAEGFTVYPINPKLPKHWREGASVAGVKSDARDSLVLATELARRHMTLRQLKQYTPKTAELAWLCEKLGALVGQRTALVLGLEAALSAYSPVALGFFSDWARPVAWRFVRRFPTPQALAGARAETVVRFLRTNRVGITETWRERIARRTQAAEWPQPQNRLALQTAAEAGAASSLPCRRRSASARNSSPTGSRTIPRPSCSGACPVPVPGWRPR